MPRPVVDATWNDREAKVGVIARPSPPGECDEVETSWPFRHDPDNPSDPLHNILQRVRSNAKCQWRVRMARVNVVRNADYVFSRLFARE